MPDGVRAIRGARLRGLLQDRQGGEISRLSQVQPNEITRLHQLPTGNKGCTSSLSAAATSSAAKTLSIVSSNEQRYSCANQRAGWVRRSSSKNSRLMRGQSCAVTW